jgi:hypothetical protein
MSREVLVLLLAEVASQVGEANAIEDLKDLMKIITAADAAEVAEVEAVLILRVEDILNSQMMVSS